MYSEAGHFRDFYIELALALARALARNAVRLDHKSDALAQNSWSFYSDHSTIRYRNVGQGQGQGQRASLDIYLCDRVE